MKIKKNKSTAIKKPRKSSGLQGFGENKKEKMKEEIKGIKKKGPKLIVNTDGYRTVPKCKKLIFIVPNFGVELYVDSKVFTTREFHRLFPCDYKDFNIIIDNARNEVSFHIPFVMAVEHELYVRYRVVGTFIVNKYIIKPKETEKDDA